MKRNGQTVENGPWTDTTPTLLLDKLLDSTLRSTRGSTTVTTTSGYRRECPRVECGQADDLPWNLVAHTLALAARTRHHDSSFVTDRRHSANNKANPRPSASLPQLQPNRQPPLPKRARPMSSGDEAIVFSTLSNSRGPPRPPAPRVHACCCCCPARDWCRHGDARDGPTPLSCVCPAHTARVCHCWHACDHWPPSPHAACSPACKHMHSFGRPQRRVQSSRGRPRAPAGHTA